MKCNKVLPGKAVTYITVILLVYLVENANLFWKHATLRWGRISTLITGKRSGGQSHVHWTICVLEITATNPK